MLINKYVYNNKKLYLTNKLFGLLTKIVYQTLTKEIPSLHNLSNYLNSLVDILLALDKPIIWITPNGLTINLSTIKYEKISKKIKTV